MSKSTTVDPALEAELIKFNAFLEQNARSETEKKAQKKARRARDEAAAYLKEVLANPKSTPDDKAKAEAAWKAAIEGKAPPSDEAPPEIETDAKAESGPKDAPPEATGDGEAAEASEMAREDSSSNSGAPQDEKREDTAAEATPPT